MAVTSSVSVRAMILASGRADASALLAGLGIEPGRPDPGVLVDAEAFYEVIEKIVADGGVDLAYRHAAAADLDDFGAMGLAFKTAATVGQALERGMRYGLLLGNAVHYELRADGSGGAAYVIGGRPAHRPGVAVVNEAGIAALLTACRQAVGRRSDFAPTSVTFAHGAGVAGPVEAAEAFFGCPVQYQQESDALHFDREQLETSNRLGDAALSEFLFGRLDDELVAAQAERGFVERIRHAVASGLADGVPPMRVIAGRLGMSERTLHRRLADDDLRYQDLVVDVRRTLALALLTTTEHSIVDVAFLTGFSDQSAFQRAFKRWTGDTPLQARHRAIA